MNAKKVVVGAIATLLSGVAFAGNLDTVAGSSWVTSSGFTFMGKAHPNWFDNTTVSVNWLASATAAAPAAYVFTIDLDALTGGAGTFNLQYAADNEIAWTIAGGTLGGTTSCATGSCYNTLANLSGTYSADAILTATVTNYNDTGGPNASGLLVAGNAIAAAVPEPSTWAMWLLGAVGIAGFVKRRAR